ncbi:MAG: tRNA (guanine-N2)-dimethyltransferase [Thermoplasmataceae archaeon]
MIVKEGIARISVPDTYSRKGPGTKTAGFYNSEQLINRDLTIMALSGLKPRNYLDGFGATGVRTVRVAAELGIESSISEINPASLKIIRENLAANNVSATVYDEPFQSVVSRGLYEFIDIDPYGSAVPYLDAGLAAVRNGGYLGITATDLSVLTGSVPSKTRRRYGAFIANDDHRHEAGIRLLLADVVRRAATMDRYVTPVLSFWHGHFYRIIVRVRNGSQKADRSLDLISVMNFKEMYSDFYEDTDQGPVWKGDLEDTSVISRFLQNPPEYVSATSVDFASKLAGENTSFMFFEMADAARSLGLNLPRVNDLIDALSKTGSRAYRTHFSNTGIKFTGSWQQFTDAFLHVSRHS